MKIPNAVLAWFRIRSIVLIPPSFGPITGRICMSLRILTWFRSLLKLMFKIIFMLILFWRKLKKLLANFSNSNQPKRRSLIEVSSHQVLFASYSPMFRTSLSKGRWQKERRRSSKRLKSQKRLRNFELVQRLFLLVFLSFGITGPTRNRLYFVGI